MLKAFWRLGIVSEDKDLGLRSVTAEKVVGTVALREEPPPVVVPIDAADYEKAQAILKRQGYISAPMLQRHLNCGYNRAARIVDEFRAQGLVRPGEGCRYVPV